LKVIVGLGNPGRRYRMTRHNLGFRVLDSLSGEASIHWKKKSKFSAWLGFGQWEGSDLILVKPATFVNASGEAVRKILSYYNISSGEMLVITDDVSLPPGILRIRRRGGAGGHHGLESIIDEIGSREFARIRIGIGGGDLDNLTWHVLSRPGKEEEICYNRVINEGVEAISVILREGIEFAMNRFNRKDASNPEQANGHYDLP